MFLHSGFSKDQDQNISFNSPYKNIIKHVNINRDANDSYNEENDFKMCTNKVKAVSKLGSKSKSFSKRKRQIQKTNLVKHYGVSITKCDDFNSQHTDLALALSKSLQATEDDENFSINYSQSEENVLALRANLKRFGFETSQLPSSNVKLNASLQQEHKRQGKFKFITPTLFLRTEEDRNRLIANKVDCILLQQNTNINENKHFKLEKLHSEKLYQFYSKGNKLFNQVELTNFYVEKLSISPKTEKVDHYLRDWSTIPGRDRSPSPEKTLFEAKHNLPVMEDDEVIKTTYVFSKDTQKPSSSLVLPLIGDKTKCSVIVDNLHSGTIKNKNTDIQDIRSISPDLFESDEEFLSLPKIENNCNDSNGSSEKSRMDIVLRNETDDEKHTYSICLSDSQVEKSLNVTEYVMKLLSHDSTICLTNLNSTENLDSSENDNEQGLNFSNKQSYELTDKRNSFNKLIKDQEDNDIIEDEIISRCNINLNKEEGDGSINLNNMDKVFHNNIPFLKRLSNTNAIDVEEDNVDTREVMAHKITTACNVYSNEKKYSDCYPSIEILNNQKTIEISSEDEDSLPIISVRKKVKAKSTNSFSTKSSNCKFASENENNIHEHQKIQSRNYLVQITPSKNTLIEKERKQKQNITSAEQVKETYSSDFNKDSSQDNFQDEELINEIGSTSIQTPKQQLTIKVDNVTPMINYEDLDSPEILKELDKFGLKPLKRKRGIQFLKYMYESTHPVLDLSNEASGNCPVNEGVKRKVEDNDLSDTYKDRSIEIVGDLISEKDEDIIIERKRSSSKYATCDVPLHIAWFNFISCNPQIKESILLYEPLQLESLNASLREQRYRYNIEDLLHFLDKKCINIRRNNIRK